MACCRKFHNVPNSDRGGMPIPSSLSDDISSFSVFLVSLANSLCRGCGGPPQAKRGFDALLLLIRVGPPEKLSKLGCLFLF